MTEFEREVLREVLRIPFGQIRTYGWLARKVKRPNASRAVASALRKNPYPLFIPCHRVVRSNGDSGGYSLGRDFKKELLALEKKIETLLK